MIVLYFVVLLCLLFNLIDSHLLKRSMTHNGFPNYSLRYKHPNLCNTTSSQTSGYFEVPNGKNFFFWLIESSSNSSNDPLVLWINGGPGCSSLLGLFMGTGPCYVNDNGDDLIQNPFSWTRNANVLYLDQPVSSGFSFSRNDSSVVSDSNTASEDMYAFLLIFQKEFPKFAHSELHIAGESYAGHFLPALANTIHTKNSETAYQKINLKSVIIGNGLTDPLTQYQYYHSAACESSSYRKPLIESNIKCEQIKYSQNECQNLIEKCYKNTNITSISLTESQESCLTATMVCNNLIVQSIMEFGDFNMYDIRRPCEDESPLCYKYFDSIKKYLDKPDVKETLGVEPSITYELCNSHINEGFQLSGDLMRPYINDVSTILNNNISVLAYAGDADFICNWKGVRAWVLDVPWYGKEDFNSQKLDQPWYIDNESVGEITSNKHLTFLRVFKAGHMAAYDQPKVIYNMLNQWISGEL